MNNTKLIYKAIGLGYEGDPKTSTIFDIQEWIIATYNIIPCVHWDTKKKLWKAYVYDYGYDPIEYINKIKSEKGVGVKEATKMLDVYIKDNFVVRKKNVWDYCTTAQEGMQYAIEKAFEKIKKT